MSASSVVLRTGPGEGGGSTLLAPSVGVFTSAVTEGALVAAGQVVGTIDVLGVWQDLRVPDGIAGRITRRIGDRRSRVPVQYGDALLWVSDASMGDVAVEAAAES